MALLCDPYWLRLNLYLCMASHLLVCKVCACLYVMYACVSHLEDVGSLLQVDALAGLEVKEYEENLKKSWVYKELAEGSACPFWLLSALV